MSLSQYFQPRPSKKVRSGEKEDVKLASSVQNDVIVVDDDCDSVGLLSDTEVKDSLPRLKTLKEDHENKLKEKSEIESNTNMKEKKCHFQSDDLPESTSIHTECTLQQGTVESNRFAKFAHRTNPCCSAVNNNNLFIASTMLLPKPNHARQRKNKTADALTKWVPMKELSDKEQKSVVNKWHSLILISSNDKGCSISSAGYTMEDRRFQILVSALLHARCQEPVVRAVMTKLLRQEVGPLTVNGMTAADPTAISKIIASLQYHNSKAKYIVQAAKELRIRYGGIVPEQEKDLKELPGIGPVFADILSNVNTRHVHEQMQQLEQGGESTAL